MENMNLSEAAGTISMTWYVSYWNVFQTLKSDHEKVEFVEMLCKYWFCGELPDEDSTLTAIFAALKPNIDSSYIRKMRVKENGSKGGAPKGNQNAKKDKQPDSTENNLNKNTDSNKEIDKKKKEKKERYNPRLELGLLSEETAAVVTLWVDYKEGRAEPYSKESFKVWKEILDEKLKYYEDRYVIETIKYSIANQYKNVVWARLADCPRKNRALKSEECEKEIDRLPHDEERDKVDGLYAVLQGVPQ